jgi:hypothetical protein
VLAAVALICLTAGVGAGHALTGEPDPLPEQPGEPTPTLPGPGEPVARPAKSGSYIDALAAAGLANLSPDMLIELKSVGVTADYVAAIHAAGYAPRAEEPIGLFSVGVRPEELAEFRALGMTGLAIEDLVAFRSLGVTPAYIRALQEAGYGNLPANDYVEAKATGITPDFITKARAHGFTDLSLRKLGELKAIGVL